MEKTIKLVRAPGIPQGFCLTTEVVDGESVTFLMRLLDKRRIRVEWIEGTKHYTARELSAHLYKDGDEDNPRLKGLQ